MLGNRSYRMRMYAVATVRSDLLCAFSDLGGGCLLMSEAPEGFL